jgi:hypothetical protein
LILSFFHGWSPVDEAALSSTPTAFAAVDLTLDKAPVQHPPAHTDHCLTHLVAQLSQEAAAAQVEFGGMAYLFCDQTLPTPLTLRGPFKPPRA